MYNHNFQQRSPYSSQVEQENQISMEELQEQMSLCFAENSRLKQALKRSRDQQLTSKKQYDSMFRQLQIEQCRLMLTIQEQDNQIRKMAKEVTHTASQSTKSIIRDKDMALLQQEIETLTSSLNKIKESKQQSSHLHEEISILNNIINKLETEVTSHKEGELRLKARVLELEGDLKVKNQKIYALESNEHKMRKTYEFEIHLLQKEHQEILKMIEPGKQDMYSTENLQTQKQLEMMINKVRESNKELVNELDLKANQTQLLIDEIENLKEAEIDLKEIHYRQKLEISESLDLLVKGFNDQIANYQNKMLFMLEYLEEVEAGKAEKGEQMRENYIRLKKSMGSLIKHVIKS